MKIVPLTALLFIALSMGCSSHVPQSHAVEQSESGKQAASNLTLEQQRMLVEMQAYMKITGQLTQACEQIADGNKGLSLATLEKIDWSNSEVKIASGGIDAEGTLEFFKNQPGFKKESCSEYASALYRDSIN